AKRTYWLRGKIFAYSRYKAWNVGILTCRVNPKDTSRRCARCGAEVARYAAGEPREGYRPGAPLVWCPVCLLEVNAAYNASQNIGHRLVARYQQTQQEKPPTRSATGEAPKGAGVMPSHVAAGQGGHDGPGTA